MPESASIPHWYRPESDPLELERGDGARVYDTEGREYLDFTSQLYCVNAGHGNEAIVDAMANQLREIGYVSPAKHNPARSELAARLVDVSPAPLEDVYFAVSGSEANEAAVQFAREYADAPTVLTRWRSYHGGTYGAGGLTGDPTTRKAIEEHAAATGAGKFLPPLPSAFDADSPGELAEAATDHLEFVIRNEGPDSIAALLTEVVGGTSGAYTAPPGYFERVRELCDEYDILLIADEVITGFGRCGEWFGVDTEGLEPDMLTFAKGVTSAYAPLAGVMTSGEISHFLREEGVPVGQTFGGHPVACAGGVAALDAYADGLIDRVRDLAPDLERGLRELEAHDAVADVRGRGFLWAVEFADPGTGEPFVDPWVEDAHNPVRDVLAAARERGTLVGPGRPPTQVMVAPPFTVEPSDIEEGVAALGDAIDEVFG